MRDLLTSTTNYVVNWDFTWFTLKFLPSHDASFTQDHASRHHTFKFKLFLDNLPTLEKLYMDELTCYARKLADIDPTPFITKLTSLSCWSFSSTNWSSYALIRGCLSKLFVNLFIKLSIPRTSEMKVVAAVHNNFVEDAMNITYKLQTTPWPSNLPKFTYLTYSSLHLRPYTNHVTPEPIG
ncbi:unnamed protein product [Rhizophagus irregularis]|nr:unnamed protein product [Rhizophagus irregularis]